VESVEKKSGSFCANSWLSGKKRGIRAKNRRRLMGKKVMKAQIREERDYGYEFIGKGAIYNCVGRLLSIRV
jgi:hypothetical protein